jgi:hypothetical protein
LHPKAFTGLVSANRRWSQEQAAADSAWAARLEEAHSRWLRERGELEHGAAEKLACAQELAVARYDALRGQLEGRVAAISEQLAGLTAKEGKKEAARKELKQEVGKVAAELTG